MQITESGALVVTGRISEIENPTIPKVYEFKKKSNFPTVLKKDFYKELKLRGYHYTGAFQAVKEARADGLYGKVEWIYNWVTFMDAMMQIHILGTDSRSLLLPTKIRKLRIWGLHHFNTMANMDPDNRFFDVYVDHKNDRIVAGGIELIGLHASPVQRRRPPGIPVLEKYQFLSHFPSPPLSASDAVRSCVQIALENSPMLKIKIVELDTDGRQPLIVNFLESVEDLPVVTGDYLFLSNQTLDELPPIVHVENGNLSTQTNCNFVVVGGLGGDANETAIKTAAKSLTDNGYLVVRERTTSNIDSLVIPENYTMIAVFPLDNNEEVILLMQYKSIKKINLDPQLIQVSASDTEFGWVSLAQQAINSETPAVLYAYNEKHNGLIGLVNCLRKEPNGNLVTCYFIDDVDAPVFSLADPFYSNQHSLGLAINVYRHVSV